jgi:hypothetical protein
MTKMTLVHRDCLAWATYRKWHMLFIANLRGFLLLLIYIVMMTARQVSEFKENKGNIVGTNSKCTALMAGGSITWNGNILVFYLDGKLLDLTSVLWISLAKFLE